MQDETLYSAPLPDGSPESVQIENDNCQGIQAFYTAALACEQRGQWKQMEVELHAAIAAEDAPFSNLYPQCLLMLGRLYLKKAGATPDLDLAVKYLEKGLDLAPASGNFYAGDLGMACERCGKPMGAIHWYRIAVEEFGQSEYKVPLYRLYLEGWAGIEKKREAEERMKWMPC